MCCRRPHKTGDHNCRPRMRLKLVGLAVHDIDAASVGLPSRNAGSVVLVGIGYTLVILLAVLVLVRVRVWIAPAPEKLYEVLALFVCGQLFEGGALLIRN